MVERLLGGNMVIGLSDEPIEEVVRPPSFYWYAEEDDFDEEGNLKLTVSAGRFRHKWVPSRRSSARLFIREHEGGEEEQLYKPGPSSVGQGENKLM